jgi:hypothetical protein
VLTLPVSLAPDETDVDADVDVAKTLLVPVVDCCVLVVVETLGGLVDSTYTTATIAATTTTAIKIAATKLLIALLKAGARERMTR